MGRVQFRHPCPRLQAPCLCLHGGQEGLAGRDYISSLLALPCCSRRGGSVDWDGGVAEGTFAIGSEVEEAPPPAIRRGTGGVRSMSATDLAAGG